MKSFNLKNYLQIVECCHSPFYTEIILADKPVIKISNNLVTVIANTGEETARILDQVLSSPAGIEIKQDRGIISNEEDKNLRSFVMIDYIAGLPDEAFSHIDTADVSLAHGNKFDYREYIYYLKATNSVFASVMYQWLEDYFQHTSKKIELPKLLSQLFLSRYTREEVLRLVLILARFGFIKYENKALDSLAGFIQLRDKISLAAFINKNLSAKLLIKANGITFELNPDELLSYQKSQAHILVKILEYPDSAGIRVPDSAANPNDNLKYALFSTMKILPAQLFEHDFAKENYVFSLSGNLKDEISGYIRSGMGTLDLSIIALLKIKNYSREELLHNYVNKDAFREISKYTNEEINKSLFAMTASGILSVNRPVQTEGATKPVVAANISSKASLLKKIIARIKII